MKYFMVTHYSLTTDKGEPWQRTFVTGETEGEALGNYLEEHEETLDSLGLHTDGLRFTELIPTGHVYKVETERDMAHGAGRSFLEPI